MTTSIQAAGEENKRENQSGKTLSCQGREKRYIQGLPNHLTSPKVHLGVEARAQRRMGVLVKPNSVSAVRKRQILHDICARRSELQVVHKDLHCFLFIFANTSITQTTTMVKVTTDNQSHAAAGQCMLSSPFLLTTHKPTIPSRTPIPIIFIYIHTTARSTY